MERIQLSEGEWKIMNRLWDAPYRTIRQLTEDLYEETGWDKHTVITLLNRIEKKGALSYRQNGRAKEFYPIVPREEISRSETKKFLQKVYQGSLSMMVHSMVEQNSLSGEEIDELYQILKESRRGGGKNNG
ncbi:MAG: BlaI/MecI/CopY family transcriptional regulator [Lachnospiraceae bacterium]|nr:BlaI/MecI/CopY family transcriptional regulator [Lachnospiraceae bacterium]